MKKTVSQMVIVLMLFVGVHPASSTAAQCAGCRTQLIWNSQIRSGTRLLYARKYLPAEQSFKNALQCALCKPVNESQVIESLNFLGVALHGQAKETEAIGCFNRALSKLSENDKRRAKILSNLALACKAVGQTSNALHYSEEAVRLFRHVHASPMDESTSLNTYGQLLMNARYFENAETVLRSAIKLREKAVGKKGLELISPLLNLSVVLIENHKLAESEQACKRVISICEAQLGPNSEKLFPALSNLAQVNMQQSLYKEAQRNLERARLIAEKSFGRVSSESLMCLLNLSQIYEAKGDHELAEQMLNEAVELARLLYGFNDSKTIIFMEELANLYAAHDKPSDAEHLRFVCRLLSSP